MNFYFIGRYIICLYILGYFIAIWKVSEKIFNFLVYFLSYIVLYLLYIFKKNYYIS